MRLPGIQEAEAPREKIVDYLLCPEHPTGKAKATFFHRLGFRREAWGVLADALVAHAASNEAAMEEETPFGTRYVIEGKLNSPDGRSPNVRVVWFVETGETAPRLVTAYPLVTGTKR